MTDKIQAWDKAYLITISQIIISSKNIHDSVQTSSAASWHWTRKVSLHRLSLPISEEHSKKWQSKHLGSKLDRRQKRLQMLEFGTKNKLMEKLSSSSNICEGKGIVNFQVKTLNHPETTIPFAPTHTARPTEFQLCLHTRVNFQWPINLPNDMLLWCRRKPEETHI